MWVYSCFEGDVDMARAWVQHDLYFTSLSTILAAIRT
jgi:hypothetical protein